LRGSSVPFELEIGDIGFWLSWLAQDSNEMFADRFGVWFARHISREKQQEFVMEFNRSDTPYRGVLAHRVLARGSEITTDDFSRDAISFLLAELCEDRWLYRFHGSLLGNCATESFVAEYLLPLVYDE